MPINIYQTSDFKNSNDLKYIFENSIKCGINGIRINLCKYQNFDIQNIIIEILNTYYNYQNIIELFLDVPYPNQKIRIIDYTGSNCVQTGTTYYIMDYTNLQNNELHFESIIYVNNYNKQLAICNDILYYGDGNGAFKIISVDDTKILVVALNCFTIYKGKSINLGIIKNINFLNILDSLNYMKYNLRNISFLLSFVEYKMDIIPLIQYKEMHFKILAKIENNFGIKNLNEIIDISDGLVLARGDLALFCKYEELYDNSNKIIQAANRHRKNIYCATDILTSMELYFLPNRADIIDISHMIYKGCNGFILKNRTLQLENIVNFIRKIYSYYSKDIIFFREDIYSNVIDILNQNSFIISNIIEKPHNSPYVQSLYNLFDRSKMLPILLKNLNNSYKPNEIILNDYNKEYEKQEIEATKQIKTVDLISDYFSSFNFIWIKGIPISVLLYSKLSDRRIGDIDILVQPGMFHFAVNLLLENSFKPIGCINQKIGLRFSINYNEVLLISPYQSRIEIKEISGEMDVFYSNAIKNDFFTNTTKIDISKKEYITLNINYTLFHLFLSAITNSTTWFHMNQNGLRDLYEIKLLVDKYVIDFSEFLNLCNNYQITNVIIMFMRKINNLFGITFIEKVLNLFSVNILEMHPQAKFYDYFYQYYDIDIYDELFDEQKKQKAYYKAIYLSYNNHNVNLDYDLLNRDLLSYKFIPLDKCMSIEFVLKDNFLLDEKRNIIQMMILSNNTEIHNKYGFIFILRIEMSNNVIKAYIDNKIHNFYAFDTYYLELLYKAKNISQNRISIIVTIPSLIYSAPSLKICYNIQLLIDNPNDNEMFRITEICPLKNTLVLLKSDYFNEWVKQ